MGKKKLSLIIDPNNIPNVLLIGNGLIRLGNKGIGWEELLDKIKIKSGSDNLENVPLAMQPEVLCGVDVDYIQRKLSESVVSSMDHHNILKSLLSMPFDAIMTTNYTYEIESILSGKSWSKNTRKGAFTALDGKVQSHSNTHICNMIVTSAGRVVPVFHLHGEIERKKSMILSYYSYANSVSRLIDYNRKLANSIYEHQIGNQPMACKCWLDYFILGNVWSVGFGLDVSEFDLWWAIERKAREVKAKHGKLHVFLEGRDDAKSPQKLLLNAMGAECSFIEVLADDYESYYGKIISQIEKEF